VGIDVFAHRVLRRRSGDLRFSRSHLVRCARDHVRVRIKRHRSMRGTAAPGGARTVLVDALELAHRSQRWSKPSSATTKRGRFGEVSASFADEVTVIGRSAR